MRAEVMFLTAALVVAILNKQAVGLPSTERGKSFDLTTDKKLNNRTNGVANQHYENLRHIIASEQGQQEELSREAKKEKSVEEDSRALSLEELKIKCQHFSRLFGLSQYGSSDGADYSSTERFNRPVIEITRRPVFIKNRPAFIQKNEAGFYVTVAPLDATTTKKPSWTSSSQYPRVALQTQSTSTTTPRTTTITTTTAEPPSVTTIKPKITIKYTKYEPVILQKTVLTDGRVMYHWHKSLPTAPVDITAPLAPPPPYAISPVLPLAQRNLGSSDEPVTTTASSTTTTERSSWLFLPFSSIFGGSYDEETPTTTAETSTSSSWISSTPNTVNEAQSTASRRVEPVSNTEDVKQAQLKLVVPIHYEDLDSNVVGQTNKLPYQGHVSEEQSPSELQIIKTVGVPHTIPRFHLGYTGNGYGLTYGDGLYGPAYLNYQPYGGARPGGK